MLLESEDYINSFLAPQENKEEEDNSQIIEKHASKPIVDPKGDVASSAAAVANAKGEIVPSSKSSRVATLAAGMPTPLKGQHKSIDERAEIGVYASQHGITAAAKHFGVSIASAQAYKNGKNTTAGPVIPQLVGIIDTRLRGVRETVVEKLEYTLGAISNDEIDNLGAIAKVKAAQAFATMADKLAPIDKSSERTLIIKVPERQDTLDHYNVIDVTPEGRHLPSI